MYIYISCMMIIIDHPCVWCPYLQLIPVPNMETTALRVPPAGAPAVLVPPSSRCFRHRLPDLGPKVIHTTQTACAGEHDVHIT